MVLVFFSSNINAASPDDCYDYMTKLVRSSNFPFSPWGLKPKQVNLVIDIDNSEYTVARLRFRTFGTGTIGWIKFDKINNILYNIDTASEKEIKLKYNNEYLKVYKACLEDKILYQVNKNGRLYLMEYNNNLFTKTTTFILQKDYVEVLKTKGKYSLIKYQTRNNKNLTGWVVSDLLREINFNTSW